MFCPVLYAPENGEVTVKQPAAPGQVADFKCREGFNLKGERQSLCQAVYGGYASWNARAPRCERM